MTTLVKSITAMMSSSQTSRSSQMQINTDGSLTVGQTATPINSNKTKKRSGKNMGNSNSNMSTSQDSEKAKINLPQEASTSLSTGVCKDHPCHEAKKWMEKYKALLKRVELVEKELKELKENPDKNPEVRKHVQHFYQTENSQKMLNTKLELQVETLSNVVIRLEQKLQESTDALVKMQARSMRRNLIISGIEQAVDEEPGSLMLKIDEFIKDKLQVQTEIPLKTYHRLGYIDGSGYRPVLIRLADLDHKPILLSNAPKLKGQRNDKNKFYYINEQLPEKLQEEKRYALHWMKENKTRPEEQKLNMKIHRNKLQINNRPYQKKVQPPAAAEILNLEPDDIRNLNNSQTVFGNSATEQGSEFISFAAKVNNEEEVRIAYRKLRLKYANATHIMSAHRFDPPNGPINQEANDDGEIAGGRKILTTLQDQHVTQVAVFIVRFYGGLHIGPIRFDIIKTLTLDALKKIGLIGGQKRPRTRAFTQQEAQRAQSRRRIDANDDTIQTRLKRVASYDILENENWGSQESQQKSQDELNEWTGSEHPQSESEYLDASQDGSDSKSEDEIPQSSLDQDLECDSEEDQTHSNVDDSASNT